MLAEGLLKNRLIKAAEGGTEIFKFGEQELLVPVGHVVLGLWGLLEAHRLGHGLRVTAHLERRGGKERLRLTKLKVCSLDHNEFNFLFMTDSFVKVHWLHVY